MPCFRPIDAYLRKGADGKNHLYFKVNELKFPVHWYTRVSLPCGRCIGCRLERSRQWASRIMCESQLHENNSFLTLTYAVSPDSLCKRDCQLFLKRLRKKLDMPIRYYLCGEYGDRTFRPHYHCCLFGSDFSCDRVTFKSTDSGTLYYSELLTSVWGLGHTLVGDLTFESAAYVARYCTKKITGPTAVDHYQGREPEFALMSRRPGIGGSWLDDYMADVYPSDELVVRGHATKPPRYFDSRFQLTNPSEYDRIKKLRAAKVVTDSDLRLAAREECVTAMFNAKSDVKETRL